MSKKHYPRFVYHADKGSKLLESHHDEKRLGFGWSESPVHALTIKLTIIQRIKRFLIKLLQGKKL